LMYRGKQCSFQSRFSSDTEERVSYRDEHPFDSVQ
jgi:hypothetical protein